MATSVWVSQPIPGYTHKRGHSRGTRDKLMDRQVDGWTKDGWTDGHTDEWRGRWMDGQTDGQVGGRIEEGSDQMNCKRCRLWDFCGAESHSRVSPAHLRTDTAVHVPLTWNMGHTLSLTKSQISSLGNFIGHLRPTEGPLVCLMYPRVQACV